MKTIIPIIRRFSVAISILVAVLVVAYVVIMGWGETLGVDPAFQAKVERWAIALFASISAAALRIASTDSDGDGTPDIIDDDPPNHACREAS